MNPDIQYNLKNAKTAITYTNFIHSILNCCVQGNAIVSLDPIVTALYCEAESLNYLLCFFILW